MPKQIRCYHHRHPPLLLLLLLLCLPLHRSLVHGLLAGRLKLLVDPLKLLDLLLLCLSLGLEVRAEPALDALHAVWAQDVSTLELTASAALVQRSHILEALAGQKSRSLLPVLVVS